MPRPEHRHDSSARTGVYDRYSQIRPSWRLTRLNRDLHYELSEADVDFDIDIDIDVDGDVDGWPCTGAMPSRSFFLVSFGKIRFSAL